MMRYLSNKGIKGFNKFFYHTNYKKSGLRKYRAKRGGSI